MQVTGHGNGSLKYSEELIAVAEGACFALSVLCTGGSMCSTLKTGPWHKQMSLEVLT